MSRLRMSCIETVVDRVSCAHANRCLASKYCDYSHPFGGENLFVNNYCVTNIRCEATKQRYYL